VSDAQILTKDSVTVAVDAVVYYRISNPWISVINVENAARSTQLLAQTTLRNILGTKTLSEILTDRESISTMMQVISISSIHCYQRIASRPAKSVYRFKNYFVKLSALKLMFNVHTVSFRVKEFYEKCPPGFKPTCFCARQHICYKRAYAIAIPSVCLFVRLSVTRVIHAKTIVVLGSCSFHHTVAPSL